MKFRTLATWLLRRGKRAKGSPKAYPGRRSPVRRSILSVQELEPRDLLSTIPFDFTIPPDVAGQTGGVHMLLYGQLGANYNGLLSGTNVYLKSTGPGTYDYAATSTLGIGTNVPFFLSTTTALSATQVNIPNVLMNSARAVISVGSAAIVPVNDSQGDITAPTPLNQGSIIYDYFEFSYLDNGAGTPTLSIDTSSIDQFGFPIQLNAATISPAGSGPSRVGVQVSRSSIIGASGDFQNYVAGTAFVASATDPFGTPSTTRLTAPADILLDNGVTGVNAVPDPNSNAGTLTNSLYYYAVSALSGANEAYLGDMVIQSAPSAQGSVLVTWAPPATGSAVTSYNVYRGTISGSQVTWHLAGSTMAAVGVGGSYLDKGTNISNRQPPFDPLSSYYDATINELFNRHISEDLVLTVTDGSLPANGIQYTLTGRTVSNPLSQYDGTTGNTVLEFTCTSMTNVPAHATILIPLKSKFYVYKPFFQTNTFDSSNPSPPTWTYLTHGPVSMPGTTVMPSGMVWSANGAFADNVQQAMVVPYLPIQPSGLNANAYSVALGSIEDQINAALTRGIALRMNSRNWGNAAPTSLTAAPNANGNLNQTYYYVVTTLNASGESTISNEVSFTPQGNNHSVLLSWTIANANVGATGYNIYRGTAAGQENQLITTASSTTTAFFDDGSGYNTGYPLNSYTPPTYYPGGDSPAPPTGVMSAPAAGGSLDTTYYYVITTLDEGGESTASNEVNFVPTGTNHSAMLSWTAAANATGYNVYRGTTAGQENELIARVTTASYQDSGSGYALGYPRKLGAPAASDLYAQFFHQTAISVGGLAYASPYDDQSNQSSTIFAVAPLNVQVTLGSWTPFISPSTADLVQGMAIVINGGGFDPDAADNTVTFSSGIGTVTQASADGKQVIFTFTTPPSLGPLTATVATVNGGNSGPVQVATVISDNLGPMVIITSGPALNTVSTTARFAFAGTDNGTPSAQLEYLVSLDSAPFGSIGNLTTATYPNLSLGMHTFRVEAKDLAGRTSTASIYTWNVTTTSRIVINSGANQSALVSTVFAQPILATALDPENNPVADALIYFQVIPARGGAGATLTSAYSDQAGNVTITATANQFAGTYLAKARNNAAVSAPFALTNVYARPSSLTMPISQTFTGDFNGDQQDDVAALTTGGQWLVGLSGDSVFSTAQWAQWSIPAAWYRLFIGDFNADGRDDIAGMSVTGQWYVGLSDGSGSFATGAAWTAWSVPSMWYQLLVGDFNGDGRDDIAGMAHNGTWWVGLSDGNRFNFSAPWAAWSASFVWNRLLIGDFNDDGRDDIAGFAINGSWWVGLSDGARFNTADAWAGWSLPATWNQLFVGDWNGDGRADIAGVAGNGTWWIGLSNGTNAFTLTAGPWATWAGPANWSRIVLGDFNGDGRTDVAGLGLNGQWTVGLSNGTNALTVSVVPWATWAQPANWQFVLVGDFNNDGRADVAGFSNTRLWWTGSSTGNQFMTDLWATWT